MTSLKYPGAGGGGGSIPAFEVFFEQTVSLSLFLCLTQALQIMEKCEKLGVIQ
jgi:hypothetical protein